MHSKFTKHGKGSGRRAVDYLLAECDHKGEVRAEVSVLRGNPEMFVAVADSLSFSRRYTSGVIAWAPEDAPTDQQISAVLDDWERMAFAGLEPDQYSMTAVLHRDDDGGVHIHTLTARVELATGKALNIAPPGHLKDFDAFRDMWNYTEGWARPDDPARGRLMQPGHEAHQPRTKTKITEYLTAVVESGLITNAAEMRAELAEIGEVIRQGVDKNGVDFISIRPVGASRNVRLKGDIFNHDWDIHRAGRALTTASGPAAGADRANHNRAASTAREQFDAAVSRRAEYNQERYQAPARSADLNADRVKPATETEPGDTGKAGAAEHQRKQPDPRRTEPEPESSSYFSNPRERRAPAGDFEDTEGRRQAASAPDRQGLAKAADYHGFDQYWPGSLSDHWSPEPRLGHLQPRRTTKPVTAKDKNPGPTRSADRVWPMVRWEDVRSNRSEQPALDPECRWRSVDDTEGVLNDDRVGAAIAEAVRAATERVRTAAEATQRAVDRVTAVCRGYAERLRARATANGHRGADYPERYSGRDERYERTNPPDAGCLETERQLYRSDLRAGEHQRGEIERQCEVLDQATRELSDSCQAAVELNQQEELQREQLQSSKAQGLSM